MHHTKLLKFGQYGTMFENLLRCRNFSFSKRSTSYNSNHDNTPCKLQISVTVFKIAFRYVATVDLICNDLKGIECPVSL